MVDRRGSEAGAPGPVIFFFLLLYIVLLYIFLYLFLNFNICNENNKIKSF